MKLATTLTLLALLVAAGNALALEQEGGIRFQVADPVGDFADSVDDPGAGLALHYGLRPVPVLTIGAGLDAMIYGSQSRRMSLPLVDDFDLTTTNNLASGFLFAQYRPLSGPVQPYAEARVGLRYLWTESKLEDPDWFGSDEVARHTNQDDFASVWGGGGGLLIRLCQGKSTWRSPGVFLDLKATYERGAEAEYLTEGDIAIIDNEPVFTVTESATDLMIYELGVVLTF